MSAEIEIPSVFGRYTDNHLNIKVEGKTVGECIDELVNQFPDIKKILLDKNGKLSRSFDIYVNGENAYPVDMTKPVNDGDKLNIMMLIFGG